MLQEIEIVLDKYVFTLRSGPGESTSQGISSHDNDTLNLTYSSKAN